MGTKKETGYCAIHCGKTWLIMTRLVLLLVSSVCAEKIPLPNFQDLRSNYPGYKHHGGVYSKPELLGHLALHNASDLLINDTSALRLSYSLNHIGGVHSLGTELIRLSKFGHDSVQGQNKMQYIYLPIAFGPYLADKYGYPNISKLHMTDPSQTKHSFWGQQGILRVITYTEHGSRPKGHVALWDCNHFHQSKDWIAEHNLLTVEFWASPDSACKEADLDYNKSKSVLQDASVQSDSALQAHHQRHEAIPQNVRHRARKLRKQQRRH
ncbi:uncharacterized protein LOC127871095 isoform X2 [Dreissena polymorpha]|uniref:uncharacterized protein LOC127871095 isoform X2 n=1 Tax=Dreissena polymorpha TaxID=45954 RepID=UPI002263C505|nr:uncharacterized protein LOC127871095 isoform X2 [Dreissena polymorpha]XP_052269734.1 uncharacterized protein LOC127871095 isoform X2 [Dreissena polymorpha]